MILDILKTHHCNEYVYTRTFKFSEQDYLDAIAELKELEATIEAQEVIIKSNSDIMEAMAQPKECTGCRYFIGIVSEEYICDNCDRLIRKDYYEPKAQP